jgi:hypothetical protein
VKASESFVSELKLKPLDSELVLVLGLWLVLVSVLRAASVQSHKPTPSARRWTAEHAR